MRDADLKVAYAHHLAGRLSEAESCYRVILEADPMQIQAMSMLGMILMDSQRIAEAKALFDRLLAIDSEHPHALHNLGRLRQIFGDDRGAVELLRRAAKVKPDLAPAQNDLAVSLHRLGQFEEAIETLEHALAIDPGFAMACDNLGVVLYDCQRYSEACEAHLKALTLTPVEALNKRLSIQMNLAAAAYEAGELATSEEACRAILDVDERHAGAMEQLAKVRYRQHRDEDAKNLLNRLARIQGLERKAGPGHPEATILVLGGVGASHVSTRHLFDPELFSRLMLVMLSPDQTDAPLGSVSVEDLADADLIFNAMGEAENSGSQIHAVERLAERLSRPLLNAPDLVARTGRDRIAILLEGIPGLRVPRVQRVSRGEPLPDFPFLMRPAGTHGGKDLSLIKTGNEFSVYMGKTPGERFLLSEFFDFRGASGHYRKYRFIFVDRKPYPYHLAIDIHWMVHYWRTDMRSVDWKAREEESFLTDWTRIFGPRGVAAVEEVAMRMDLDYGGMDCSILPNGEVLFFEANACMLVHLDEADAACKKEAVMRIRDAVTTMVRNALRCEGATGS